VTDQGPGPTDAAVAEVVTLASELIAIDTTNTGDTSAAGTERKAAEYVAGKLSEVGYDVTYVESGAPGRGNVIARLPGADPARGALLLRVS
jgi:acetylornithine deacetylase/succinyl-diaminopimelate desuccinylase-like protein